MEKTTDGKSGRPFQTLGEDVHGKISKREPAPGQLIGITGLFCGRYAY